MENSSYRLVQHSASKAVPLVEFWGILILILCMYLLFGCSKGGGGNGAGCQSSSQCGYDYAICDVGQCFSTVGQCSSTRGGSECVEIAGCDVSRSLCTISMLHAPYEIGIILQSPLPNDQYTDDTVFKWPPTGQKEVVMALLPERLRIEIDQGRIRIPNKNSDQIVWMWHSGLGGSEGAVRFTDGQSVKVKDGKIVSSRPPVIPPNGVYFWAVWAWQGDNLSLISESRAIQFGKVSTSRGQNCTQSTECADPLFMGVCVNNICEYRCASRIDCPVNELCNLTTDGKFTLPDGRLRGGYCVRSAHKP